MQTSPRHIKRVVAKSLVGTMLLAGLALVEFSGQAGLTVGSDAVAQGYSPARRGSGKVRAPKPRVSPYLNLLRNDIGGTPPGVDYFTQVRPQFQQQRVNAQQQAALRGLEAETSRLRQSGSAPLPITGRGATYRNYSHFYPSLTPGNQR